jgi:hypothetical protein
VAAHRRLGHAHDDAVGDTEARGRHESEMGHSERFGRQTRRKLVRRSSVVACLAKYAPTAASAASRGSDASEAQRPSRRCPLCSTGPDHRQREGCEPFRLRHGHLHETSLRRKRKKPRCVAKLLSSGGAVGDRTPDL